MATISNLISFPYIKAMAEYAMALRRKIDELEGEEFIIAVDLPQGLEDKIMSAVNLLPRISLVVDNMGRSIPIIPTDAAIEALRISKEYGLDVRFLDTGLPIPKEIFRGTDQFYHLLDHIGAEAYSRLLKPYQSEYQKARCNYIANSLKTLIDEDMEVLFLCDIKIHQKVLKSLDNPRSIISSPPGKSVTCHIKEEDVWKISPEIPYIMFLFENSRESFNRADAILNLFQDENINIGLVDVYKYAHNLAISDGQFYPDIYNILVAAKSCADDEYAYNVLERSKKYPFAYIESNCNIKSCINYDLEPLNSQKIIDIQKKLKFIGQKSKKRRDLSKLSIFNFQREPEHLRSEKEFINYLKNNYFHLVETDEYQCEEFICGMADGIAIKESVRYSLQDNLFIKNQVMVNNTAYVIDYGLEYDSILYFDTQNYCVGTATSMYQDEGYIWSCLTILPKIIHEDITKILGEINSNSPLNSCKAIAQRYAEFVYVFTNKPEEIVVTKSERNKIKIISLDRIPENLKERMQSFRVNYGGDEK